MMAEPHEATPPTAEELDEHIDMCIENRDHFMRRARARRAALLAADHVDAPVPWYQRRPDTPLTVRECVATARHYNRLAVIYRHIAAEVA